MENPFLIEKTNKPVLYHYTSVNALFSILDKERLWITRSDFLNDYMEKNYFDLIFYDVIREIKSTYPNNALFFDILVRQKEMHRSLNMSNYVLSLTDNPDSLVLWSNYSNHDGYNIGFNVSDLTKNNYNIGVSGEFIALEYFTEHGHVIYNVDKQKEIIFEELKSAALTWENYENFSSVDDYKHFAADYDILTASSRLEMYSLFFKHPSFSTEEEYRFVFSPSGTNIKDELVRFRVGNGVIVPYIEMPLQKAIYTQGGKLPLHNVTIGPKNNLDTASTGIKVYLKHKEYPDSIQIRKSEIPLRF